MSKNKRCTVTDMETLYRMERARSLREGRTARGATRREEAARLGITVAELRRLENVTKAKDGNDV